jgi:hypothetical protein
MLGEYVTNPLAVSIFGAVLTVNTLLFIALQGYIVRNLIKPELKSAQDPRALVKALVGPASYLIGAAVAWVSVHAALVIYLLTPLFYITPPEWHGKTQPAADDKKS